MNHYEYIIVGAGPAGLQMAYFLEQAGRSYVVLEKAEAAGDFFAKFPRHRTLISINKVYNWFSEPDFNLRYDWNSLLTYDSSLLFTDYSKKIFPNADILVKYLHDFAEKFALRIQYNTEVTWIDRETEGDRNFVLTDQNGAQYTSRCLFMANGAVKPNIPMGIEGIENIEGYEVHDPAPERFTNKRVLIMGIGNTAFEIADCLAEYAATVQIYTGGRQIKHAWQTHFVGDLRAINNGILDMAQLKMPHLVSGASVKKVEKNADGTFKVYYEEEVPHWAVPGTMKGVATYDAVIRATGWKYIDKSIFAPRVLPETDAKGKFPVMASNWESSVPDLFFIGAAMANNDRKTTPGFIHGFRYNVRTVFHLAEQRYNNVPLPVRTMPLTTPQELEEFVTAMLTRVSTTSALYQMFGVLGEVLAFDKGEVKWYPELPMKYALAQPEFAGAENLMTVTLELGFDSFAKNTDSLSFIHPNDPAGRGRCTAFIHPVFRRYSKGELVGETHLQSGVFVRYDEPNAQFSTEFDKEKPRNVFFNLVNAIVGVTTEIRDVKTFMTEGESGIFEPWPEGKTYDGPPLPVCNVTHGGNYVPSLADYR